MLPSTPLSMLPTQSWLTVCMTPRQRAAFTLSPFRGYRRSPDGQTIHVGEGQLGWLRVTLLDDELSAVLFRFLQRQPLILRLGDIPFAVQDALGAPGSHPWAGYATLDELRAIDQSPDAWTVEYASPVAIRWGELPNGQRRMVSFPHAAHGHRQPAFALGQVDR